MGKKALFVMVAFILLTAVLPLTSSAFEITDTAGAFMAIASKSVPMTLQYGQNGRFIAPIDPIPDKTGWTAISDRDGLEAMLKKQGGKYFLSNDIDLDGKEWDPPVSDEFTGTFDGQGHVIKNLTSTSVDSVSGLFQTVNGAVIKNVGLEDVNIDQEFKYAGGICAHASGSISISNCYNTGKVFGVYGGGICGSISSNTSGSVSISNCYNTGNVAAYCSGGICGSIFGKIYDSISISNCYNTGDVSGIGVGSRAGGVSAGIYIDSRMSFDNCYNTGNVSGTFAGGIFCGSDNCYNINVVNCCNTGDVFAADVANGICDNINSISNCCNTGNVTAVSSGYAYAGGICNSALSISNCCNTGDVTAHAPSLTCVIGGICSSLGVGAVSNCYNTGAIFADFPPSASSRFSIAGGICGDSTNNASVNYCYNTGVIVVPGANVRIGGIVGYGTENINACYCLDLYTYRFGTQLTETQMNEAASYIGFDFDKIWDFADGVNNGYPILQVFSYRYELSPSDDILDSADSWAREGIASALEKGFIPTELQGDYTNTITRQEFCRMSVKWVEFATGKDIDTVLSERSVNRDLNAFIDTNDPDILAAFALGITNGTGVNQFTPNGEFTREQAATMIMRTCEAIGADTSNQPVSDFIDLNTANSWALDGINFVGANGIMSGTSSTAPIFSPKSTYTRQESIVTFNNINPDTLIYT